MSTVKTQKMSHSIIYLKMAKFTFKDRSNDANIKQDGKNGSSIERRNSLVEVLSPSKPSNKSLF